MLEKVRRLVTIKEVFDVMYQAHLELLHGKRVKMVKHLARQYSNVPRKCIEKFLELCPICIEGTPCISKCEGLKPIITKGFNYCAQVDLTIFRLIHVMGKNGL